jgi:hypothetical protein
MLGGMDAGLPASRQLREVREARITWPVWVLIIVVFGWLVSFTLYGAVHYRRRVKQRAQHIRIHEKATEYKGALSAWIKLVASYPLRTLAVTVSVPMMFSILGAAESDWFGDFKIDMNFADYVREESDIRFTQDAVESAISEASDRIQDLDEKNFGRRLCSADPLQYEKYWQLDVYYEATASDNIFTPDALHEIKRFEERILQFKNWDKVCNKFRVCGTELGKCKPPASIVSIMFPRHGENSDIGPYVAYDGSGQLTGTKDQVGDPNPSVVAVLKNMVDKKFQWFGDKDFGTVLGGRTKLTSKFTRSTFRGGLPMIFEGESEASYKAYHKQWLDSLYDEVLAKYNSDKDQYKFIKISWYEPEFLLPKETSDILLHDVMFSLCSFAFVVACMIFQVRSVSLTIIALFGMCLSYGATYYFYFVVLGYKEMSLLNFVSVFLMIGIAADDVLIMVGCYSHAGNAPGRKFETLSGRMYWAYGEAASAMAVTTISTSGSFFLVGPIHSSCRQELWMVHGIVGSLELHHRYVNPTTKHGCLG